MLKHNHHQQQLKRFGVHLLADDFRVQKILGFVNHHQKYQRHNPRRERIAQADNHHGGVGNQIANHGD